MITDILIPMENVSDEYYIVLDIKKKSDETVQKDELLFVLESSKATVEISAQRSAILHHSLSVGQKVELGSCAAYLYDTFDEKAQISERTSKKDKAEAAPKIKAEQPTVQPAQSIQFTSKALKLVEKYQFGLDLFKGCRFVDERSVEIMYQAIETIKEKIDYRIKKNSIVIIGGGGHAKMLIDIIRSQGAYDLLCILDGSLQIGKEVLGVPVWGDDSILKILQTQGLNCVANGVGLAQNHKKRSRISLRLEATGLMMPNIIHPKAVIEPSAQIGTGNQIMAGAIIGSEVKINDHCIINSGSIVSHDCIIDSHVHIAPGSAVAGGVQIGSDTIIGMNSTVYFGVSIGKGVQVANGTNVHTDVKDGATVHP